MFFDGGARGRIGTSEFLVWANDGSLVVVRGLWYGSGEPTNNTAELRALVDVFEYVQVMELANSTLYIHGNCKLAIDFCQCLAQPS